MRKKRLSYIFLLCLLGSLLILAGCQQVFTFSPFSRLQRDPSQMSPEQKEQYAKAVLASGDTAQMADAYVLIAEMLAEDPGNGELHLLAADLAIGASGLGDLITGADPESGLGDADSMAASLNTELLSGIDGHIQQAEASGQQVSDSQYVNAGAAIVIGKAAENDDGLDGIDWENDEDINRAQEYAERGGVDIEGMFGGGPEETETETE